MLVVRSISMKGMGRRVRRVRMAAGGERAGRREEGGEGGDGDDGEGGGDGREGRGRDEDDDDEDDDLNDEDVEYTLKDRQDVSPARLFVHVEPGPMVCCADCHFGCCSSS